MENKSDNFKQDIENLNNEIAEIKKKLLPDKLAKIIDRSYFSINNFRLFLTVFSIMLTIFLAGAVYFGIIGVQNISKLQEKIARVGELEEEVVTIRARMQNISELFNKVAIRDKDLLNAREQQLLILLAREIDPDNPVFRFNAANVACGFGRYEDAIRDFDLVLKSPDIPTDIKEQAEESKIKAQELMASPPEYPKVSKGPTIGPFSILGLHVNTLRELQRKGYFSGLEIQAILDDSKSNE